MVYIYIYNLLTYYNKYLSSFSLLVPYISFAIYLVPRLLTSHWKSIETCWMLLNNSGKSFKHVSNSLYVS